MKISYAITVCNEFLEIQKLVPFLLENKRIQDEIVILYDQKNGDPEVLNYLLEFNKLPNVQTWRGFEFEGHFANWKNKLTSYCTGDYIFQIDADEIPNEILIHSLPEILENNNFDICMVPRVNTVENITEEHIKKWGWRVNEHGWINWPDKQWRLYKNTPEIKWEGKVHERLVGFNKYTSLPETLEFALFHHKTIDKQEKQNEFYNKL
jgi:hypothetical protein